MDEVFDGFESGSIQQIIYQIGSKMLADIPVIARGQSGSQQPHLGHDRWKKAMSWESTRTRVRPTAAWA